MLIPPSLLKGGERPGSSDLSLTPRHPVSFLSPSQGCPLCLPLRPEHLPVISVEAMIHFIHSRKE